MGSRRLRSGSFSSLLLLDEPEEKEKVKEEEGELQWPFGRVDTLSRDDVRETAYELLFACCRSSSPGFSGRSTPSRHSSDGADAAGKATPSNAGMASASARVKSALGLRARPATPMRTATGAVSASAGGTGTLPGKGKQRAMTAPEIMRLQMGITEQTDARLRKTLTRFLVGQVGRQVETIILPLELLRHLRPNECGDPHEYHRWQQRQLKVLEAGLLVHPSVPSDRMNSAGLRFREILAMSELKPIDTSKHSEAMRNLCNCVMSLAWRYQNVAPVEVCHWADGFPLNVHLYLSLLRCIFDLKDEAVVLDEVDDLLELMKKTWATLGIYKMIHNVCFTWVLFEQYIATGQVEPDLMNGALVMLDEVAIDAKRPDREPGYLKILIPAMTSLKVWAEKNLFDYHEGFEKDAVAMMENVMCLALTTAKIITEEASSNGTVGMLVKHDIGDASNFSPGNRVDQFIRTTLKTAFTKVYENGNGKVDSMVVEVDEDPNDTIINLAKETENLALLEKETYSPFLKRWHPFPTSVAVVTLHNCYGAVLKQYLYKISGLSNELVRVLHTAGNLEQVLVQMTAEESAESEDCKKGILGEMIAYEVDTIIFNLMKCWMDDRLRMGRECISRARETESWNPMSKSEPYAESAVDLMKLAKVTVDEFFEIQIGAKDELAQELAGGLDTLFKDYSTFAASCGSKESYIPAIPSLTRCNQDSKVAQLWKKASTPCNAGVDPSLVPVCRPCPAAAESANHRHIVSRGTQRLYVRLNTLHHILGLLHSMEKSFSSQCISLPSTRLFDSARSSIHSVILHVAELAAYRLIFLDSSHFFYDSLYFGNVATARIQPTLRVLHQNVTHLTTVLIDRAQPQVVREVLKASFEAFLMVLLAGGSGRAFTRADYDVVAEDFKCLKRMFTSCGGGALVTEEVVDREAETVEGVMALMNLPTEKLVEDFSIAACEASGLGRSLERVPMPPTTGRWHYSDPNTMLRVLCHRNDDVANRFLKKAFELPKRR